MSKNILALIVIIGLFAVTGLVAMFGNADRVVGLLFIVCGALAIYFSRAASEAQRSMAESPFGRESWKNARPFTYRLWGAAVMIIGVVWAFLPR
jgi:hypothetical protein